MDFLCREERRSGENRQRDPLYMVMVPEEEWEDEPIYTRYRKRECEAHYALENPIPDEICGALNFGVISHV